MLRLVVSPLLKVRARLTPRNRLGVREDLGALHPRSFLVLDKLEVVRAVANDRVARHNDFH